MLSITKINNAGAAKSYYEKDNYYADDDSKSQDKSQWYGSGANQLGLTGSVDKKVFEQLLEGYVDDRRLGKKSKDGWNHKPGWDLTFSAPKSVSILAEVAGDRRLFEAHKAAVDIALNHAESRFAITRLTNNKKTKHVVTGKFVIARFNHNTSRALDPQLHTHSVILNLTSTENGWRSLESRELYDAKMHLGMVYRSELANRVKQLGYEIDITRRNDFLWDIKGVDKGVLNHFSQRSQQIKQQLKELGWESSKAAEVAALDTRDTKSDVDHALLHKAWKDRLDQRFDHQKFIAKHQKETEIISDVGKLVNSAIKSLSERESRFSLNDITQTSMMLSGGSDTFESILNEVEVASKDSKRLIKNHITRRNGLKIATYTTSLSINREKATIRLMRREQGAVKALFDQDNVTASIESVRLTDGQRDSVMMSLTTSDRFIGVQGYAGTGKTTMLAVVKKLSESEGMHIKAMAPSAAASKELGDSLNSDFSTLDKHLAAFKRQQVKFGSLENEIWFIDEAGMLSSRQTLEVMQAAERSGARIIFVGDTRQLEAVEAGRPFVQLQEADMKTVKMPEIMRQRDEDLLNAVKGVISRDIDHALEKVANNIIENDNKDNRLDLVANKYLSMSPKERDNSIIIVPANDDREKVNELVRNGLVSKGQIASRSSNATKLVSKNMTSEELGWVSSYRTNDVVRFKKAYKTLGVDNNEYFTVIEHESNNDSVKLKSTHDNREIIWNPGKIAGRTGVELYTNQQIRLAAGDNIRWKRPDTDLNLINGDLMTVESIYGDIVTMKMGNSESFEMSLSNPKHKHYEYAYTDTVYTAQGKTVDKVIALAESYRKNLVNEKSFYVQLSRARDEAILITDSRVELQNAIESRRGENTIAIRAKEYNKTLDKQIENERKKSRSIGSRVSLWGV